jgi:hypothetical protein
MKKRLTLIKLKLFNENDVMTLSTFSYKKRKILSLVQVKKWKGAYLKVVYNKEYYNDGIYCNYKLFKQALDQFTEDELVRYLN